MKLIHRLTLRLTAVVRQTRDICSYSLADPDGWELPPFTAGAHVDLHLPGGRVRQYSLCGDPADRHVYEIAVRREDQGRGGSLHLHREARAGDLFGASLPRNHFPIANAEHHVLIAGGIGITPFLSMIAELEASGRSWELHYACRSPQAQAFRERLASRAASGRVHSYFSQGHPSGRLNVGDLFRRLPEGAAAYCCGPARLIHAARKAAREHGAAERLHDEFFGLPDTTAGTAYVAVLARSGKVVSVSSDQTLLQALRLADVELPSSCEGGVCLECKVRFLEGNPVHRDLTMKPADRASHLTPCVSGCAGERIVLDL